MVQLEEVRDEEFLKPQIGPEGEEEDDWDTDSDSDTSSLAPSEYDDSPADETLYDRLAALKDIIPPTYRTRLQRAGETGYTWASSALGLGGKTLWVVSTSALLLGVPWALAFAEEQQMQEMEREMRMQQSANELLTRGAGQTEAKPAV